MWIGGQRKTSSRRGACWVGRTRIDGAEVAKGGQKSALEVLAPFCQRAVVMSESDKQLSLSRVAPTNRRGTKSNFSLVHLLYADHCLRVKL